MGTSRYPDLHLIEKSVYFEGAWRIIPKKYQKYPIGMGLGKGHFSATDGEFKVLYDMKKPNTAVRKTLIPDNNRIKTEVSYRILGLNHSEKLNEFKLEYYDERS